MSDEKITALIQIACLGQITALESFLREAKDIDVNRKNKEGSFAAIVAAKHNDLPMLQLLVKYGAKLDLKDGFGRTVKGWAEKHNNTEMLRFINDTLNTTNTCNSNCHNSTENHLNCVNKSW